MFYFNFDRKRGYSEYLWIKWTVWIFKNLLHFLFLEQEEGLSYPFTKTHAITLFNYQSISFPFFKEFSGTEGVSVICNFSIATVCFSYCSAFKVQTFYKLIRCTLTVTSKTLITISVNFAFTTSLEKVKFEGRKPVQVIKL